MNDFVSNPQWTVLGLAKGATILLALGAILVCISKGPAFKQRTAELTVLVTAIWIALAITPLPRLSWSSIDVFSKTQTSLLASVAETDLSPEISPSAEQGTSTVQATNLQSAALLPTIKTTAKNARAPTYIEAILWNMFVFVSGCLIAWIFAARVAIAITCLRSRRAPNWIHEIYDSIGKRKAARVLMSRRVMRPMSFGVIRPVILLPENMDDSSKSRPLLHVFLHEQTHIDRRDAIGNTILILALPLLWCHPLYWYLRFTVDNSREMIADDSAAHQSEKHAYVSDLIDLLRNTGVGSVVPGAIGVLGFEHPFTRRMAALLKRSGRLNPNVAPRQNALLHAIFLFVLVIATAVFGARSGIGQEAASNAVAQNTHSVSNPKVDENQQRTRPTPGEATPDRETFQYMFDNARVNLVNDLFLMTPEEGQVEKVHVRPGQEVKKGQVLITISNPELEQAIAEAVKSIAVFESTAGNNINTRDAVSSLEAAKIELRALEEQPSKKDTSQIARAKQLVFRSELRVELAAAEDKKHVAELEHSKTVLEGLRNRLSRLELRAPIDCVVETVNSYGGQTVGRGEKLIRLISLDQLRVEFSIDNSAIFPPQILHQDVLVDLGNRSKRPIALTGKVSYVSTQVDMNNQAYAWAICDNVKRDGHWAVRPGMMGKIFVDSTSPGPQQETDPPATGTAPTRNAPVISAANGDLSDNERQQIVALQELIASQNTNVELLKQSFENGVATRAECSAAQRDLWRTKAELAIIKHEYREVQKCYEKAIALAQEVEADQKMIQETNGTGFLELSLASRTKAEIKLDFLRYQQTSNRQPASR